MKVLKPGCWQIYLHHYDGGNHLASLSWVTESSFDLVVRGALLQPAERWPGFRQQSCSITAGSESPQDRKTQPKLLTPIWDFSFTPGGANLLRPKPWEEMLSADEILDGCDLKVSTQRASMYNKRPNSRPEISPSSWKLHFDRWPERIPWKWWGKKKNKMEDSHKINTRQKKTKKKDSRQEGGHNRRAFTSTLRLMGPFQTRS